MKLNEKRRDAMTPEEVQEGNGAWWSSNPMTYDWQGRTTAEPLSREWFDAMDARFLHGTRLFATASRPFDRIIPLEQLRGKKVLEIGCGMGLHTETMVRAGANVTAVDLTQAAIEATTRRLELKGLEARLLRLDAERLPFDRGAFDFVWSWGVIHHSARTARIVREIARVVTDQGACRVMVYNREGMAARVAWLKDHLLRGGIFHRSYEETLFNSTDGFSARFYVREQFEDLFRAYFTDVRCNIVGQDADVVPLPSRSRGIVMKWLSPSYVEQAQARRGSFLFLTASRRE